MCTCVCMQVQPSTHTIAIPLPNPFSTINSTSCVDPGPQGTCSFALEHNTDMLRSAACIEKVTREVNGNTVEFYAR